MDALTPWRVGGEEGAGGSLRCESKSRPQTAESAAGYSHWGALAWVESPLRAHAQKETWEYKERQVTGGACTDRPGEDLLPGYPKPRNTAERRQSWLTAHRARVTSSTATKTRHHFARERFTSPFLWLLLPALMFGSHGYKHFGNTCE